MKRKKWKIKRLTKKGKVRNIIGKTCITIFFLKSGEFGDVYKGELTCGNGKKIPVAVKTLKVCIFMYHKHQITFSTLISTSIPFHRSRHISFYHNTIIIHGC